MIDPSNRPTRLLRFVAGFARWSLGCLLTLWLLLAVAWGALHGWIVPRIGEFRPQLEAQAARALGLPVRIGSIAARSEGWLPSIELLDVALLDAQGRLIALSTAANGVDFGFTDDVVIDKSGHYAYFSDASSRFGYGHDGEAIIEHGGDGRLLRYDFQTGKTAVLLDKLEFANGVTLGPDEAFVLVNETGAYRISRYWLSGPKAGTHDLFIDNLPGLPDNLAFNGRDRFWVALYAPRNALLDATAAHPFVRKMIVRAMTVLPKPVEKRGFALGLDVEGKVIANLQDGSRDNYSPITTVREYGEWLYFGSLKARHMVRLPLSKALQ